MVVRDTEQAAISDDTLMIANNQAIKPFDAVRGALIDLDGTLIDHFHALYRCYKFTAGQLGYTPPSPDEVKRAVGGSMPITIRHFFREADLEKAMIIWREHFDAIYLEDAKLMPGGIELLQILQDQQIAAAVFTNKIGRHSRALCQHLKVDHMLSFVLGAEDTPHRKPEKAFSEIALERLGSSPEETVLIGDSPFDIEAALSVGMDCIAVPTGSHTNEELIAAGAETVLDSLLQIAELFGKKSQAHL